MTAEQRAKLIAQAKVGLDALIDEATGHQQVRPKDALARRYAELGGDASDYKARCYCDRPASECLGDCG